MQNPDLKVKTFGTKAFNFFKKINPDFLTPAKVELLLPFKNNYTAGISKIFFNKYYNDLNKRTYILGINPGRHGAGITGIPFTDPINLENECGINNTFDKKGELSSKFIYQMIYKWGGCDLFYQNFFLSSICPVGFTNDGKNCNFYDDKKLLQSSIGFIKESLQKQFSFGAYRDVVICLGEGKNYQQLKLINEELKIFGEIIPLSHPRYIMQYKTKEIGTYCNEYVKVLTESIKKNAKKPFAIQNISK